MRLFYHPDRAAFVANRSTPGEIADDEAAFWGAGDALPDDATLTVAVNDEPVRTLDLAEPRHAWQVDLTASTAWRYGGSSVRFELGCERPGRPKSEGDDARRPLRFTQLRFAEQPGQTGSRETAR